MLTALGVALLVVGTVLIVRGVFIVVSKSRGRFRFDAAASILVGFGLCVLGQALLK